MAQRIEGPYDFSKYGFMKFADGATWVLTKGEDYETRGETVLSNARKWAREEGLELDYKLIEEAPRQAEQVAVRFRRGNVRPITAVGE
jgi:hypothetical protein